MHCRVVWFTKGVYKGVYWVINVYPSIYIQAKPNFWNSNQLTKIVISLSPYYLLVWIKEYYNFQNSTPIYKSLCFSCWFSHHKKNWFLLFLFTPLIFRFPAHFLLSPTSGWRRISKEDQWRSRRQWERGDRRVLQGAHQETWRWWTESKDSGP